MKEILIGQAKRKMLGNDLFWEFIKYDHDMPDHAWWTKWSKGTETKEQGGRRFRIDYSNCNVYELVGDEK